jgi:hypothetical protein
MKEIVTIQVGSYANYIGSHFWNFQDELLGLAEDPQADLVFKNHSCDMDVLYRSGETHKGVLTYTPRLVSIDFQGSLGSVSSQGTLYSEASLVPEVVTWEGNITTQASRPRTKNKFLKSLDENEPQSENHDLDVVQCLEDNVEYWTDYSKVHYHPKSLYEINGLWKDVQDFNNYGIGKEAFYENQRGEEINERLRFFIEECGHIQGIQFTVDNTGGFSGIAGEFLENIADEYANIPVLLYSVNPPVSNLNIQNRKQTLSSNLHDAVSFARFSSFCKLIVPLGLPSLETSEVSKYLHIQDYKPYHTSAAYASALHTISLPFRMKQVGPTSNSKYECGSMDVYEAVRILAGQGRQNMVSILDLAMPAPSLSETEESLVSRLKPLIAETNEDAEDSQAVEYMSLHGLLGSGGEHATVDEAKDAIESAYEKITRKPRFSHVSSSRCPLPIPLPFPSIFSNHVGQRGQLSVSEVSSTRSSLEVHSIPMAARLRSSSAVLPFLEKRLESLRTLGLKHGSLGSEMVRTWGFERTEVEDMGEALSKLVHTLAPPSEFWSDSSD